MLALHYLSCLVADVIKLFDRHHVLVRRDLHDAVSARINDKIARIDVMLSVIPDDLSARISLVADYPPAGSL